MNRFEVERNILKPYESYLNRIDTLLKRVLSTAKVSANSHPDWVSGNDIRFTVHGKLISVLTGTKIGIFQLHQFIANVGWPEIYNSQFAVAGQKNNFVYLQEFDCLLRFSAYMKFISEIEATVLIIIRHLKGEGVTCTTHYKGFILDNLKMKDFANLIDLAKLVRDSIHNNGLHFPDKVAFNNITLSYRSVSFTFSKSNPVPLSWNEAFLIFEYLVEMLDQIFGQSLIKGQEKIADAVTL